MTIPIIDKAIIDSLIGNKVGPYHSFNPVSETQIWQWCSVVGDQNLLFNSPEYRRQNNISSSLAPPSMMQMWTMRDVNDNYAPGSTSQRPYKVFDDMTALGYESNVAVSYDITFERYLTVGERALHHTSIVSISEQKKTALGIGYFVTEKVEYSTNEDISFATALITYFQYHANEKTKTGDKTPKKISKEKIESSNVGGSSKSFTPVNIALNTIKAGTTLPDLSIPITHKLIVAGAIASQDFIPIHHNIVAANNAAMPDIFMNILTTCGLSARYISDWAGPSSRLKKLQFNLMTPNFPDDNMLMQGSVTAINQQTDGASVDIEFTGNNSIGPHVIGSATIAVTD
tara:strand:+ start:1181 stop:2212 length:1032 start_codon:yes stop_codon:yes gene_type:complete